MLWAKYTKEGNRIMKIMKKGKTVFGIKARENKTQRLHQNSLRWTSPPRVSICLSEKGAVPNARDEFQVRHLGLHSKGCAQVFCMTSCADGQRHVSETMLRAAKYPKAQSHFRIMSKVKIKDSWSGTEETHATAKTSHTRTDLMQQALLRSQS